MNLIRLTATVRPSTTCSASHSCCAENARGCAENARVKTTLLSLIFTICGLAAGVAVPSSAASNDGAMSNVHIQVSAPLIKKRLLNEVQIALVPTSAAARQALSHQATGVQIAQHMAQFQPFVTIVQRGANVDFPNRDGFAHHVYSFSKAMAFELPLYSGGDVQRVVANKPGIVPLGCNIHDWMLGYIFVVDTPFFSQLSNGEAVFDSVPSGDYEVALWHPSLKQPWKQNLTVSIGATRYAIELPMKLRSVQPRQTPAQPGSEDY